MTVTINGTTGLATDSTSAVVEAVSLNHPSSSTAAITMDASNNVGIGIASPETNLHVSSPSGAVALVEAQGAYNARLRILSGNANSSFLEFADPDDSDVGEIVYEHANNAMRFNTNAIERLRIDGSGRVTMPYQPYAQASCSTNATGKIPLNHYNFVRGGMSIDNTNQRINVPVTGSYLIGYNHLGNQGSGNCQIEIRVNGSLILPSRAQDTNSTNDNFGFQTIRQLSANDYIEFWVVAGAVHGNADYNSMYTYLLG